MSDDALWRASVEARLDALEAERPGRKGKPILVSAEGVCGVNPKRKNSRTCPDASLWRRQKGCLGEACVREATQYYEEYRKGKRLSVDTS